MKTCHRIILAVLLFVAAPAAADCYDGVGCVLGVNVLGIGVGISIPVYPPVVVYGGYVRPMYPPWEYIPVQPSSYPYPVRAYIPPRGDPFDSGYGDGYRQGVRDGWQERYWSGVDRGTRDGYAAGRDGHQ